MLKKIESLREKPKTVRNQYAFLIAALFTCVVATFWLVSVPSRLVALMGPSAEVQTDTRKADMFGGIKDVLSEGVAAVASIKDSFVPAVQDVPVPVAEEPSTDIDFNTFFAATNTEANNVEIEAIPAPRQVLIGTTSSRTATSTEAEL